MPKQNHLWASFCFCCQKFVTPGLDKTCSYQDRFRKTPFRVLNCLRGPGAPREGICTLSTAGVQTLTDPFYKLVRHPV